MALDSSKCCLGHWVEQFGPVSMYKLISNRFVQKLNFGALHPHGFSAELISNRVEGLQMLLRMKGGFKLPLLMRDLANGLCLARHNTSLESGR